MAKELWINLPVKDLNKSREFFSKLGFSFNPRFGNNDQAASLIIGEKHFNVMLFPESIFKGFTGIEIADTKKTAEILISIDAGSREEVDEMARRALQAGGTIYGEPGENQGWMYGCGFCDLDGHRWNVLYMDINKMPKP